MFFSLNSPGLSIGDFRQVSHAWSHIGIKVVGIEVNKNTLEE